MKILSYALLIMCIGIASIKAYLTYQSTNLIVQDWTPITLPAKGIFGYCRQDRKHGGGARFSFEAKRAQPYRLAFFGGSQGGGTTLTISLNGTVINKPMILPEGWGEESSVSLPSAYIKDGSNIVDILPARNTKDHKKWGVSDIRVLPIEPSNSYKDVAAHDPGSILYALEQREMSGQQLAHYYKTVSSWATSNISERFTLDKNKIMEEIEQKMRNKLHQVAFEVRSKNILGDHFTAQQLLDDTKSWIPFDWMEGWKIYNGLCH